MNRGFFSRDFTRLIDNYAKDKKTGAPVVELHLRDGSRYYVESIELVGESWLSFRASPVPNSTVSEAGRTPDQITVPYAMINRIDFLPKVAETKVGFRINRQ